MPPPPRLAPPPLVAKLPVINTGIALSVVFDMVTKPASIGVALGIIAFGIIIATVILQSGPRRAPQPKVNENASSPGSMNSISNVRSAIGGS